MAFQFKSTNRTSGGFIAEHSANGGRYIFLAVIFALACILILATTASIQFNGQIIKGVEETVGKASQMTVTAPRGDIIDLSGRPLAYSERYRSLYFAHSELTGAKLNRVLLDLSNLLKLNGIEVESRLTRYIDFAESERAKSDEDKTRLVFKKDLEEISRWQQNKDLFNLASEANLKQDQVKLDPEEFFDYMLYEGFNIEDPKALGSKLYTKAEAFRIMQLRYQIMENNWTFVRGEPVRIASRINDAVAAAVYEQNQKYRGAVVAAESSRRYSPESLYFAHELGYVGQITQPEYEELKTYGYRMNEVVGKAGVEYAAERYLHGQSGLLPYGTWMGKGNELSYKQGSAAMEAEAGGTVRLTLDSDLQKTAVASLQDCIEYQRKNKMGKASSAACVMLDVKSGAVLAMASTPSYDPNDFVLAGKDEEASKRVEQYLTDTATKPMLNRCISEIYAPGSTFKPISASAAIMSNVINPNKNVYRCDGIMEIGYKTWVCYEEPDKGHGWIDLQTGLVTSCNLYFFQMGLDTGIDNITEWCKRFGLGEYSGIDLPGEAKGIRPSREVKMKTRLTPGDQEWYPADTCQTAIGQFDNAYTILQLARSIGGVASGELVTPHIIKEIISANGSVLRPEQISKEKTGLSDTAIQMIRKGMRSLKYQEKTHTYRNFSKYPIDVSAKTGTAEVGSSSDELTTNALFVCYAPSDNPEVVIACVVEEGGKGDVTSNIARDLLDCYYKFPTRDGFDPLGKKQNTKATEGQNN